MKREEVIEALVSIGIEYDAEELAWKSTAYLEYVLKQLGATMNTAAMSRDQMISFLVNNDCYLRDELEWWGTDAIERTLIDLLKQGEGK